jgi:hypothetical protein
VTGFAEEFCSAPGSEVVIPGHACHIGMLANSSSQSGGESPRLDLLYRGERIEKAHWRDPCLSSIFVPLHTRSKPHAQSESLIMAPIAISSSVEAQPSFPAGYASARMSIGLCLKVNAVKLTIAERKSVYKIAQIGADGIGPEVIDAGVRVLHAAAKKLGHFKFDFTELDWSSDRYKKTGSYIPDDYIEILKQHDAIL